MYNLLRPDTSNVEIIDRKTLEEAGCLIRRNIVSLGVLIFKFL